MGNIPPLYYTFMTTLQFKSPEWRRPVSIVSPMLTALLVSNDVAQSHAWTVTSNRHKPRTGVRGFCVLGEVCVLLSPQTVTEPPLRENNIIVG